MSVSRLILGMNARNYLYIRPYNKRNAKEIADNKLLTKRQLLKHNIPTPELIEVFKNHHDVRNFDWSTLKGSFVLKPARGYGGGGILIVRNWNGKTGRKLGGTPIATDQLEAEVFSILDGAYSINHLPDVAFIEKRIVVLSALKKLSKKGVPDIRIIVHNQVPIMAMLRLPTEYSNGCANLHQGAIGVGIDLRTGITTKAVLYGKEVNYIPNTKIKVRGIKIPKWSKVLHCAVEAQKVSQLGYAGIDIVLDEQKGPLVLEVNARPGLQIQLANGDSLRTRLERVEGMHIPSIEYGIDLGKRLFAESSLVTVEEKGNVLNVVEKVTIYGPKAKKVVTAKIDTGAYSTSIDDALVEELGLSEYPRQKLVRTGFGVEEVRDRVDILFRLHGKDIQTDASHTDRAHMRFQMIIGRRDIKGFLVDPRFVSRNKKKRKVMALGRIRKYYDEHLEMLSIRKRFHYLSRMHLWTHKKKYFHVLKKMKKEWYSNIKGFHVDAKSISQSVPAEGASGGRWFRKTWYEKHHKIYKYNKIFFRALFLETIYKDKRESEKLLETLDGDDVKKTWEALVHDSGAILALSTHAVNFLYHTMYIYGNQFAVTPEQVLVWSKMEVSFGEKERMESRLYLLTHAIIGASRFYSQNIKKTKEYIPLIKEIEDIFKNNLSSCSLDTKFEYLVCCRLLGYETLLRESILNEAKRSKSPNGNYCIDTLNAYAELKKPDSLGFSEHRNVLAIMAITEMGK